MIINEALPISVAKNKTVTYFSNHVKGVWNCSLCFVSLPCVKTWMKGTYDIHHKNP